MIRCPETEMPVDTGFDADRTAFEIGVHVLPAEGVVECPHCGRTHVWRSADVYFDESRPAAPRSREIT
jgi:hypothetical protein